jgi:hypothetical protein
VLDLPLDPRPLFTLTDDEIIRIYKASPGGMRKIIKNQAAWMGYAEIAEALKSGYVNYLKDIFKVKEEPAKKGWFK